MEIRYNRENSASTRQHKLQNKTSNTKNGLHLANSFAKGVPYRFHPQILQVIAYPLHAG